MVLKKPGCRWTPRRFDYTPLFSPGKTQMVQLFFLGHPGAQSEDATWLLGKGRGAQR